MELCDNAIKTLKVAILEIRSTLCNRSALIIQIAASPTSPESANVRGNWEGNYSRRITPRPLRLEPKIEHATSGISRHDDLHESNSTLRAPFGVGAARVAEGVPRRHIHGAQAACVSRSPRGPARSRSLWCGAMRGSRFPARVAHTCKVDWRGSGCWDGTVRADTPMENRARKRPHGGENDDYGLSIPAPMRHGYRMPSGVHQRCGARHLYRRSSSCGEINGWVRSSCCAPGHAPPTLSRIISYLALLHAASVAVNHLASGTQPEVGRRSRREATW
jgi:hypothetical protein